MDWEAGMRERVVNPGIVLAIVCTGAVLSTTDQFIVNIAFPSLQHSFGGVKLSTLSWVLNGYSIVFAALLVPAGRLADRASRKTAFLVGVAVFTGASALCAAANGVGLLIAARVLQASGAALLIPSSLGLLLAAYPPERRTKAVRIWGSMAALGAAVGPVLGGLLLSASWRWIFLVNVPVGLAALVAGRRWLPSPPRVEEPFPDLVGALVLMAAIGSLTLGLVEAPDWGWGSARTIVSLAGSAVLLALFLFRSFWHLSPIVELELLRVRPFAVSSVALLLFSAAFAGSLLSIVVWTQVAWGWSALKTGLLFAPGPLLVPVLALNAGKAIERLGAGVVAAAGCLCFGAGALVWAASIGVDAHYASAMLPGTLLTGVGVGLALPTLTAAGAAALPPQRFATGSAILMMSRQVGFTLGVATLVAVLGTHSTSEARLVAFRHGWEAVAVAAFVAAAAALGLVRRQWAAAREPVVT
jgi:EmrB/QacA subfamily drug resistance transporter